LTVEVRINHLTGRQQLVASDSFPIPLHTHTHTKHHFSWRQSFGWLYHLRSFTLFQRSFSYIIVVRDPFFIIREPFQKQFDFVLTMIRRWKFDPLNFSLLNHVASKHRVFFYSAFSKCFKIVVYVFLSDIITANVSVLLNFFRDFIDFSSDWSIKARCIFDIKIFRSKTLELALCMYWYCVMSINITNFFSSLSRILPFFVIKFQNALNFFFIFKTQ